MTLPQATTAVEPAVADSAVPLWGICGQLGFALLCMIAIAPVNGLFPYILSHENGFTTVNDHGDCHIGQNMCQQRRGKWWLNQVIGC